MHVEFTGSDQNSVVRTEQRSAVLNGFGHMGDLCAFAARQIGNGARHLQGAVCAAPTPTQLRRDLVQKCNRMVIELDMRVYGLSLERLIGAALAQKCLISCSRAAQPYGLSAFTGRGAEQILRAQVGDFHVQVTAVQQWP